MSRGMTTATIAAARDESVYAVPAIELLFDSGPVRIHGGIGPLVIDGNSFDGLSALVGLSEIEETYEVSTSGTMVTLGGVPADAVALALTETYQGRPARLWWCFLNRESGAIIGDPVLYFAGRMDQMNAVIGQESKVEVTLEDYMVNLDRPNISYYTHEDQQREHPGDLFFQYVPSVVNKQLVWPAKSWKA